MGGRGGGGPDGAIADARPSDAALDAVALDDGPSADTGVVDASTVDASMSDASEMDVSTGADAARDASETDVSIGTDAANDASPDVLDAGSSTDASSSDGPPYCPAPDASVVAPHSYPNICRNTQACNEGDPGFDPCAPSWCDAVGALCIALPAVSDDTPCDDSNPNSFAYPASGGCPSNQCVGGSNEGAACTSDSQCPGGSCFMNRCVDGPNAGSACSSNADCTGAAPNADCVQQLDRASFCSGGAESGHYCPSVCSLTGTQCSAASNTNTWCHRVCVGGSNPGTSCTPTGGQCLDGGVCTTNTCLPVANSPACPPAGRCVRWNADPTTGSCVATADNPHCDTVADCPTTKYCAGDPEHALGSPTTSCVTEGTDDCCLGYGSLGPCLVWDRCDTTNHVCVRSTQGGVTTTCGTSTVLVYGASCAGGPTGSTGTVCNDVCRAGRCTSRFATCK